VFEADERIWQISGKNRGVVDVTYYITERTEQFKQLLKNGYHLRLQKCTSYLRGKEIAQEFGFPLVIRPSFTGGTGAAIVYKRKILMCF
jgi:carbamoyl-phosphate synthase large subunit